MAVGYPVVTTETDAAAAIRLLIERQLPGLVVTDSAGRPVSVVAASDVLRLVVPRYVVAARALAHVFCEDQADRIAERLPGRTIGELTADDPAGRALVVDADDTVVELADRMSRLRCPLVAVVDDEHFIGVVTVFGLADATLSRIDRNVR